VSTYEPELGQLAFGQPSQRYELSPVGEAALTAIANAIDVLRWKQGRASPFNNSGPDSMLKTSAFEAVAYSWGDETQAHNFAWRDLRVSWYKYLGRGMSANMVVTADMADQCLRECMRSLFDEVWE
jgi:hypothetical protein